MGDLNRLEELKHLELGSGKITDAGLAALGDLRKLEFVWLTLDKISDTGVIALLNGRIALKTLIFGNFRMTHAVLEPIGRLENLESLKFLGAPVGGTGLAPLKSLKNLTELYLDYSQVADDGLKDIAHLTSLQKLDLRDTLITDEGLLHLKSLNRLKKLWVTDVNVSQAGCAQLQKLLPGTFISFADSTTPRSSKLKQARHAIKKP
jgi:Leucine-rich repeat (LRR) protein